MLINHIILNTFLDIFNLQVLHIYFRIFIQITNILKWKDCAWTSLECINSERIDILKYWIFPFMCVPHIYLYVLYFPVLLRKFSLLIHNFFMSCYVWSYMPYILVTNVKRIFLKLYFLAICCLWEHNCLLYTNF